MFVFRFDINNLRIYNLLGGIFFYGLTEQPKGGALHIYIYIYIYIKSAARIPRSLIIISLQLYAAQGQHAEYKDVLFVMIL